MKNEILSQITTECPWRDTLYWYDTIDSTNTRAKEMAKAGKKFGKEAVEAAFAGQANEVILSMIYLKYCCSEEESVDILNAKKIKDIEAEKLKSEMYSVDNIFNSEKIIEEQEKAKALEEAKKNKFKIKKQQENEE